MGNRKRNIRGSLCMTRMTMATVRSSRLVSSAAGERRAQAYKKRGRTGIRSILRPVYGSIKSRLRVKRCVIPIQDCSRAEAIETLAEVRDTDFRVSKAVETGIVTNVTPTMKTRRSLRVFHNIAENLEVLDKTHSLEDEMRQFREFQSGVQNELEPTELDPQLRPYYESEKGIW